jgi:hypothetical protein
MRRRLFGRLYDRFFDRVDADFSIDPERIDWIREHEPHRRRAVFGATRRNARRILQLGCIAIGLSAWFLVSALWIEGYASPLRWFSAGLLLGAGWMAVAGSRLLAYLAYLRGESRDRPRAEREEASAR